MRRYYKYGLENLRSVSSLSSLSPSSNERVRTRFAMAAGIAFIIHASFLVLVPAIKALSPAPERFHYTKLKLSDEKKADDKMFVTIAPDAAQIRPKEAKLLAAYDQSTNREMKSAITSLNPENLGASPQIKGARAQDPGPKAVNSAKSDHGLEPPAIDDFFEKDPKDPLGLKSALAGLGSVNAMPFSDHLPGVEEGDHSELNAWQWRHAPFFNRIKARVAKVWAPNLQIARYDPQGALLGQKNRVTVVSVTINQQGAITDLAIADTSEVAYLDEEADRTFRAAAPFPYPPKELFKNGDEFTFNFAFHLQINRGWSFDFDWEQP